MRGHGPEWWTRALILVLVGTIGMCAGFAHTMEWAVHHGQTGWLSWADAVAIESMAVIAGLELRRSPGLLPGTVLAVSFVVQMAAQVSMAEETVAGWLLAATPALSFLVVVKLAIRSLNRSSTHDTPAPLAVTADRQDQSPREEPSTTDTNVRALAPRPVTWPPR